MFRENPPNVNSIVDYGKVTEQLLSASWDSLFTGECVDSSYDSFLDILYDALQSAAKLLLKIIIAK